MIKSWELRIDKAFVRGCFTKEDKKLSNRWTTCAVGEKSGSNSRKYSKVLTYLGLAFHDLVKEDLVLGANMVYSAIQIYDPKKPRQGNKILRELGLIEYTKLLTLSGLEATYYLDKVITLSLEILNPEK